MRRCRTVLHNEMKTGIILNVSSSFQCLYVRACGRAGKRACGWAGRRAGGRAGVFVKVVAMLFSEKMRNLAQTLSITASSHNIFQLIGFGSYNYFTNIAQGLVSSMSPFYTAAV